MKVGFYYHAEEDPDTKKFHIPIERCPRYSEEERKKLKGKTLPLVYEREYNANYIEEADNFIPLSLYNKCKFEEEPISPEEGKTYILGVDCARQGLDNTVYGIAEVDPFKKQIRVVRWLMTSQKATTDIRARILYLHGIYNFHKIYIDVSFIGGSVIDFVKETSPDIPLEAVDFHSKSKADLYQTLKIRMERGQMLFLDNEHLRKECLELQYSFTAGTGVLRIEAPSGGNDDYPDVLAILCKHTFITQEQEEFIMGSA